MKYYRLSNGATPAGNNGFNFWEFLTGAISNINLPSNSNLPNINYTPTNYTPTNQMNTNNLLLYAGLGILAIILIKKL